MRSRTVREGSVGLFLLAGLGLFAAIAVWLREAYFGDRSYSATIQFDNAAGMQIGTPVRYRGVAVGRVTAINAGVDKVNVQIKITQPDLVIPRNVKVELNQSGFIGQNAIDITPLGSIPASIQAINPLDATCKNRNQIICNNETLQGQTGFSLDQFIRLYTDEKFYGNLSTAIQNTSIAAQEITKLSRDLSGLAVTAKQQISSISGAANSITQTIDKFGTTADKLNRTADQFIITANQINATANRTADQFSLTANRITATADRAANQLTRSVDQVTINTNRTLDRFGATADQFRLTANQAGTLATNINNLVTTNQGTLIATLDNLSQTSADLRTSVNNLNPVIDRVAKGELLTNLEKLSANAAVTSANLRDLTGTLNNPLTLLVLQQTLDSARATFQNAQKITSDLDDLTGDPAFRDNLRNLVNGLGNLVSSTNQLQEQVEVAQFLAPISEATAMEIPEMPSTFEIEENPIVNLSVPLFLPSYQEQPQPVIPQSPAAMEPKKPLAKKSTSTEDPL